MIHFLKSKSPANIAFIFLICLGFMYTWLLTPVFPVFNLHHNYLQININNAFKNFYNYAPIGYSFCSWLSLIICAFLFNNEFNKIKLLPKAHLLPSFIFCFIFLLNKQWWGLHLHYILILIVIYISFTIYKFASLANPKSTIFNLGILIGIAGMLWFPAHFFIIIVYAGFIRLRAFNIKEYLLVILGIIMPYYILFSTLFLTNKSVFIKGFLPVISSFKIPQLFNNVPWLCIWGFIFLITFIGVLIILNNNQRQVMQVKGTWGLIFFNALILLLSVVFSLYDSALLSAILIVPIASIHCAFYLIPKQTKVANVCVYITLGLIVINTFM